MFTRQALQFSLVLAIAASSLYFVFFGKRGVIKYYQLAKEIDHEKEKFVRLEQKNAKLKDKIDRWYKDDFEKEKVARENLQMSKPGEMVFVTTQT